MYKILVLAILLVVSVPVYSQNVLGKWKTIDDGTGEEKSIVHIYQENDRIYGQIIELLNPKNKDAICDMCEGEDYNKPIKGLFVIKGLTKEGQYFKDGYILDPENGKEYQCKIWLDPNDSNILIVRGYVAFFYRTQYWKRIQD